MSARGRLTTVLISFGMLNGCVAVVAPIVAAGALGGKQVLSRRGESATVPPAAAAPPPVTPKVVAAVPSPVEPTATVEPVPLEDATPAIVPPVQVAALPAHDWRSMVTYVANIVQARTRPVDGAVLAPQAGADTLRFLPCGAKPYAVIVDAEGTVLPRLDAPKGATVGPDEARRAFGDLKFAQVAVIFTSSRPPAEITATEQALESAGLGPAMQGRELLSAADGALGATKPALRIAVANQYCVLALVGDELDDFIGLGGEQGLPASISARWGAGWFRVPAQAAP